jgi:hypothetical protein
MIPTRNAAPDGAEPVPALAEPPVELLAAELDELELDFDFELLPQPATSAPHTASTPSVAAPRFPSVTAPP